jgi:hypothetical protein
LLCTTYRASVGSTLSKTSKPPRDNGRVPNAATSPGKETGGSPHGSGVSQKKRWRRHFQHLCRSLKRLNALSLSPHHYRFL